MNSIYRGMLKPRDFVITGFLSFLLAACANQPNSFFTKTPEIPVAETSLPAMTFETTQAINSTSTPTSEPCIIGAGSDAGQICVRR